MAIQVGAVDQEISYSSNHPIIYRAIEKFNLIEGKIPVQLQVTNNISSVGDVMKKGQVALLQKLRDAGYKALDMLYVSEIPGHESNGLDVGNVAVSVEEGIPFGTNEPIADTAAVKPSAPPKRKRKRNTKAENSTKKNPTPGDVLHRLLLDSSKLESNAVFQNELVMPDMPSYPYATDLFVVVNTNWSINTCKICLDKAQTTIDIKTLNAQTYCRAANLGLDLSFQERRLLYNCFDDSSPARKGKIVLILKLTKLYKHAAMFTIDGQDYLARYSVLNDIALCNLDAGTDSAATLDEYPNDMKGTFWGSQLRKFKNKDGSHPFRNETDFCCMTEPFYYKYKTKIVGSKTVVGSQYHCHKCQKFIQDTETPLEHYFTSFHNKTNPEWKQYATVLSNLLQKRNTDTKTDTDTDTNTNTDQSKHEKDKQKVLYHANRAIRLAMRHCNLIPSATDFFHHGSDACMKQLHSYFDTMKSATRFQLDKNKGETNKGIQEQGDARSVFFGQVLECVLLRFKDLKVYPWNVLYSNLPYVNELTKQNGNPDEPAEPIRDERSDWLYIFIIGCVHGTFDEKTHPVLQLAASPVTSLGSGSTTGVLYNQC